MKTFSRMMALSLLLLGSLSAESVSLTRAAELVTQSMDSKKIGDKRLIDLFSVLALRRVQSSEPVTPTTMVWVADLEETTLERSDPAMQVAILVDGKKYKRVLEIRHDQSVSLEVKFADVRQRIIPPANPRVVPALPK